MKQAIYSVTMLLCLTVFAGANKTAGEDQQENRTIKVYKLDPKFYQKAADWLKTKDNIPDDQLVKITIRGFLSSLSLGAEMVGKASFQIDPRKDAPGPLLYIHASEDLLEKMKARHLILTGSQVVLLMPEDLKIIARLIAAQEKRNASQPDSFANE